MALSAKQVLQTHSIFDEYGLVVAKGLNEFDAARAVAAINACEGIPTEQLEKLKFKDLVWVLKSEERLPLPLRP